MTTVIEVQYLPPLSFFAAVSDAEVIVLERHEHYIKQSYRNRCYINTTMGRAALIIPVTAKSGKVTITEVRIDHQQKWLNNHWRSIQSAYGKSPYFDYYAEDLESVLQKRHEFLYDLNVELLSLCLKWLKWTKQLKETEKYEKSVMQTIKDVRNEITPKKEEERNKYYTPYYYSQVFGSMFVPDLSLIDAIFCMGPEASQIVVKSAQRGEHFDSGKRFNLN